MACINIMINSVTFSSLLLSPLFALLCCLGCEKLCGSLNERSDTRTANRWSCRTVTVSHLKAQGHSEKRDQVSKNHTTLLLVRNVTINKKLFFIHFIVQNSPHQHTKAVWTRQMRRAALVDLFAQISLKRKQNQIYNRYCSPLKCSRGGIETLASITTNSKSECSSYPHNNWNLCAFRESA